MDAEGWKEASVKAHPNSKVTDLGVIFARRAEWLAKQCAQLESLLETEGIDAIREKNAEMGLALVDMIGQRDELKRKLDELVASGTALVDALESRCGPHAAWKKEQEDARLLLADLTDP